MGACLFRGNGPAVSDFAHAVGGDLRVLTGHFSCDPSQRRQQWERLETKLQTMPPLPMVVLADHNSVMVPGVDSEAISKEISTVVSARKVEGSVLGVWALQDAWVHLHGERREELRGFTREERRIDRVHMPTQALQGCSLYKGGGGVLGDKVFAFVKPRHFSKSPRCISPRALGAVPRGLRWVGIKTSGVDPPLLLQPRLPSHGFHCRLSSIADRPALHWHCAQ